MEDYHAKNYRLEYKGRPEAPFRFARKIRLARHRLDQLRPSIGPVPRRILDLGCGYGFLADALAAEGHDVTGIDPDFRAIHAARARQGGAHFICGGIDSLEDSVGQFDWILLYHVLEHLPHPVESLTRLRRLLRPGGQLLIEVPNLLNPDQGFLARFHRAHVVHFSGLGLAEAARRAGLTPTTPLDPTSTHANLRVLLTSADTATAACSPAVVDAIRMHLEHLRQTGYLVHGGWWNWASRTLGRLGASLRERLHLRTSEAHPSAPHDLPKKGNWRSNPGHGPSPERIAWS
jgi:2-polyprenyl-3-methyl-5-hydroxy-6-metoxy-1,4-benzoquinol methylase